MRYWIYGWFSCVVLISSTVSNAVNFGGYPTANVSEYTNYDDGDFKGRAYVPDTQFLDFVYHNHEELTKISTID